MLNLDFQTVDWSGGPQDVGQKGVATGRGALSLPSSSASPTFRRSLRVFPPLVLNIHCMKKVQSLFLRGARVFSR